MTLVNDIQEAISQLRNTLGALVPWGPDDNGNNVSLLAATGRLVVAPGQTIASAWGNTTYDQTVQVFDNAAQRDAQWPAPKDGAHAYLADSNSFVVRRAGVWEFVPRAPNLIQSWQQVVSAASNGGTGPLNFPVPFRAGTVPRVHISNGDLALPWVGAAIYQPGTTNVQFSFNAYKVDGNLMPSQTMRCNFLAIGEF